MNAVHDYGRDHHVSPSLESQPKPDEPDDRYTAHIQELLLQEDFAQLEKIAQQNRLEKGRLLGGVPRIRAFYNGTAMPAFEEQPEDSDFADQIARQKAWIAAYPASITPRLSMAFLYLGYAEFARTPGFSRRNPYARQRLYDGRTAKAEALLLEAASLKERDPIWYEAMQQVALNQAWDKAHARELFDQAVAFEPDFYPYYRDYAYYLLPERHGNPGDLQAFAEETAKRFPEPKGSMLYFWIVSLLANPQPNARDELPHASYPMLKQGYDNVSRLYGTSNLNANRFAFMATTFKDRPAARQAFLEISYVDVWTWQGEYAFSSARGWANH